MARKHAEVDLKKELLKALRNILKKEGIRGLDVRKIAKEAGCSIGTFYNHYKSLDDLVVYFNGETLDILTISMFDRIAPSDSAKEIINKICQNYIAFAKDNHTEWLLLLEHPLKIEIPAWYHNKSEQLFQKVSEMFHPILRGDKKDVEKAVKVLWSSLHGICSLTLKQRLRSKKGQPDPLELSQNLFHNYILGYRIGVGIT